MGVALAFSWGGGLWIEAVKEEFMGMLLLLGVWAGGEVEIKEK